MINLNFGLFWSGAPLSYLRYLTFKSLRHFHPKSRIQLFVALKNKKSGHNWVGGEKQDFLGEPTKDYIGNLMELGVEIVRIDMFDKFTPNYQSDFFRWWWLNQNGGFYLDTDQIILKPFNKLDREKDFIYSEYVAPSCGIYTPVGVVGAKKGSQVVKWIKDVLPKYYQPNDYNSLGPFMLRSVIHSKKWEDKLYNTPSDYFYPICDSSMVGQIYDGSFVPPKEAFALHWFGGHPLSQKFNSKYTEEFAKNSDDSISTFLRDKKII
jgi:hypothetical protein